MIGIGIIGCGRMGNRHAEALQHVTEFNLVGCFDVNKKISNEMASNYNIESYDCLNGLLEDKRIQSVIICTPNNFHKNDVISSLNFNKHVLVEKPLGIDVSECDEIIKHAKSKPTLKIMVGHTHRFYPHNLKVKELIEKNKIGKIKAISEYGIDPGFIKGKGKPPKWVFQKSKIATSLIDTVHLIDKIRWLTGSEIESVYAPLLGSLGQKNRAGYLGSILLTLKSKVSVHLFFLAPSWGVREQSTKIVGTTGVINSVYGEKVTLGKKDWKEFSFYGKDSPASFKHNLKGFENELRVFASSIKHNRKPPITVFDGKKSIAVIMAIVKSYETGRIISMD